MEPEIGIFSGRFGAGTKNPKTLIHVLGTDTENNSLYVSSEDIDKRLAFKHQGTTGEIFSRNYSTSVYNDLLLNKNFLIKDSGRVKIGDVTNNPVEALEISGALRLTGASATQMDGTIIYNTIGSTTDFFGRKQGEWVPLTSINKVKAGGGLVLDDDGFSISNIDPLLIGRGSVDKETFFYLTNVNKDIQLQFDDITKQLVFDNTPTENSNNLVRSGAVFSFLAGKQDKFTPESRLDARALGDGGITNRTLSYLINVESDIQVQINNITNYDTVPKANSLQGVTSKGIFDALALKAEAYTQDNRLEAIAIGDGTVTNTAFGYLSNVKSDIQQQIDAIPGASAADNFPTNGSENFVKSSGIHTRLSEKHPLLTVTNTLDPTLIGDGSVSTTTFGYLANVNKDIQFQLDNVTDNIVYDNTPIQNSQNPLTSGSLFVELGKKQDTITTSNLLDASLIGDGTIHNQTLGYIRNLKGDIEDRFSEITTIAQDKTPITTYVVTVEGNPKKFYIDGVEAPQLTFIPGSTYRFNVASVTTANYRFYITTTSGGGGGLVGVTNGITNNGIDFNSNNTMLTYKVPHYPTGKIYYASIDQTNMGNRINVIDQALQKTDNVTFNDMTISGNLTVSGNQTIVNTSTISVEDPVITIGSNTTDDNLDRGVEFKYNDGSAKVGFMGWDDSASRFVLLKDATNTNEVFTGTDADLQAAKGLFSGDIVVGGNKFQVSSTNGTTSVGGQLFVTGNSSISGTLTMDSNKITNVTDPTDAQDASTKAYVDSKTQNIPTGATLTLPKINDSNSSHKYEFAVSDLTANRTMTLPLLTGNDEFVFKDHTQTLTNKTLTSPVVTGGTINNTPIGGTTPNTGSFTTINASSNVTIGGSQTTTGLTNSNGGIAVDTDKFTVATNGNTITKGTLTVSGTGATTLGGTLDVTGLTTTAGITASGLLNANAGIAVDTDKFTVADTSGNVSTKGTLSVESTTTLTGDVTVSNLKLNADDAANKTMTVDATNSHATGEGKLVLSASDEVVVTDGTATVKIDGGVLSTVTSSVDLDSSGAVSINSSGGVINIGNDNVNQGINIATSGTRNVVLGTTTTNLDINSAGATIDSTTLAINSTNTTGITMTANDASTKKITIQAKNSTANHVGEINMIADGDVSIVPGSSDGTTGSSKVLKVDSTAAIRVPVGTTAQRNIASNETDAALKAAAKGSIRYNTNTLTFEGYNGGTWGSLGGVKDVDQDTLITSESTPGADEDTLTFQTGGTKRATMDASGNFDVYDSTGTNSKFKVTNAGNTTIGGTLGVSSTSTMTGLLNANGGIAVNTDKFTVAANGNTTTDGTLSSKSDFKVNTNKFVVIGTSGNTTVAGTMDITGDTGIDGDFDIATNKFTVASGTGNTTVAGTLDVTGNTGIDGDFDIATNKFTVASSTGNTAVAGTLDVTGLTTTAGITASGLLNANAGIAVDTNKFTVADGTGNTSINGTLSVNSTVGISGDTTLNDANLIIKNSGAADKFKVLAASGNTDIKGTLDTAGDFKVASNKFTVASGTGNTTVAGTLDVTGNTGIDGDFDIATDKFTVASGTGNTTVAGTLGVTGLTTTAGITASGLLNANGGIATDTDKFTVATNGNTVTKGTLTVSGTGATTLGGDLSVGGTNFQVVATSGNTSIAGTLTSDGNVTVENATLKVRDGSSNDKFTVAANGNTTVGGTLGVTGVSTMTGLTNANGGIAVDTDKFTVATNGNTVTKGTLTVSGTGATELGGSLTVTGTSTFNDNVSISGNKTLTVGTGLTTLGGNLQVDGNLTISGTTTTVNTSTITVEDPVITVGTNASDDNKDRGVEIKWHDGTGSKIGFFGMDDSTGEFTFIQDATNTNEVFSGTAGNAKFTNMTLGGTLGVTGTSTLSGLLNANGGIAVDTNKFTVADGSGNTAIAGTLNVTGNTTVSTISASGQIDMNSNKIVNVTDPTSNQDAATKKYVDDQTTAIPANALLTTPRINDSSSDNYYQFSSSELTANRTVTLPLLTGDDEFVFKDHTQTLTNKTLTNPDINGGTIDSATIATSDITVGAGKTLNVSAGTLTLADNQISGDKVEGGTIAGITITTLGSTTVNSTTVDTTNIEVTNIKAKDGTAAATIADSTGVVTIPSSVLTTTDINGGTIDNATIATSNITVGTGKTLNVSAGTLTLADNQISGDKVEGGTIAGITITTLGSTTVNSTTVDTTNIEVTNIKAKDGTSAATIADSTGVVTISSSVLTTTDINGGTIDSTTIGANTPAAITGTTITANTNFVGNVTGTVSSIANHDTSDLSEGTNLYHTTARARASVSVTDSGGDGSLAYNSTSGVITYTGPSAAETRAHFSAGTGVGISGGEISIGQAVGTTDNVTFGNIAGTLTTAAQANITTMTGLVSVGSTGNTTTFSGPILADEGLKVDTISEDTTGSGVTIDGVVLKDNSITASGGVTADLTGNAATATKLETARTIAGQSFDGSANITIASTDLSDASTFTAPKSTILATARTIGGVSFNGSSNIDLPGVNTSGNQDTSGNAATATVLATARTIGGVSFDGSASINLPGVNATGNQDTSGNAATATKIASITNSNIVQLTDIQTLTNKTLTSPTITGTGTIAGTFTGDITGDVTGNADTATKIASIANSNIVQLVATQTLTNKTLTSPTITGTGAIAGTFTGDITGDVTGNADTATKIASITNSNIVQLTETQTLTNKTLTSPTITGTGTIAGTFTGDLTGNADTATKIASITNSNIVQLGATQTLTNKTLTSPTITGTGAIAGTFTGNLTGNADTATKISSITNSNIVQLGATQTLTNKTLTSPTITGTGAIAGTFTGDLTGDVTGNADTATKIASITNSNIVQLTETQTLTNKTLTSPTITGTGTIAGTFTGNITGNVTANTVTINSAATSTNHAVTKGYVDSVASGLDVKKSVRVATTTNGTLASSFANGETVDGITLATGDRILIKNQTTGSENGIYTVNASGAPTRATDFDDNTEVTSGAFTFVEQGTVNADNGFALTTDGSITVGTTALVFTQFTGAGSITAGAGLSQTGNTIDVNVDGSSLEVSSDTVRVKSGGITNTMLANNTISFGGVSLALGGTDATPAFDLSDATNYPTSSLTGTITNAQLAGSIANDKLANNTVSFGGVSLALGGSDATPAFDLSDATGYPTSSLTGTITNAQLAGSIANDKLANNTVSFGGVSLALGGSDTTPAFNLSDATGYPTSSLTGTITNAQLAGSIANDKLSNNTVSFGGVSLALGATDATPAFDLSDATNYPTSSLSGTITNAQLAGSIANSKLANSGKLNDSTNVFYSEAIVTASGGKFYVDGTQQQELHLQKGMTYRFNQSDSSNNSHPFYFSTTSDGTHNSGSKYTTGVTEVGTPGSSGSYTQIIVQQDTPTLYYYCGNHSGMGGKAVIDIQEKLTTGSIANDKLANNTISFGGISLALGGSDATPAFDLSDATNYPTSSLSGTITNAQLAGSIANDKLANNTVSFGGVSLALGGTDATPAFNLSDATNYPTSSLSGTITNAQLAGSIANDKLANNTISFGGVSLALGGSDATPAFDLSDSTNYPTSSLSGTIANTQLAGSIANSKLANSGKLNDSTNVFYSEAIVTVNGSSKYVVDGTQQQELHLQKGMTYRFNQSDSSNNSHPFRFSTTSNGTHNSGSNYTTGVTEVGTPGSSGSYTQIIVQQDTPTLYYYCGAHSGMGGKAVIDIQEKLTTGSVTNDMLAGTIPIAKGGTGATTASAARTALGVDAAGTDNSTNVTLATVSNNYLSLSGQAITAGTVPVSLGGTGATSASAARTALGAIDGLTVKQDSTTNSNDATYTSITTLIFDYDAGLQVSNPSTGEAKITLGSHWKTIQIDGTNAVTPSGEETLNLIKGTGINITGNSGSTPQSLTFSINAALNDLSNVSAGSPSTNDVLKWNGSSWVPGSVSSGGATSLDGLSDVSVSSNQITFGSASTTAILPADDNGVDLGSASYSFKDAHIQGVIHATQIKTGTPTFTLPTSDGSSGQFLKTDGNGALSWGTASSGGSSSFTGLSDTPSSFSGQGGKFLKVNSTPNAVEFASFSLSDIPSGGASTGQVLKWSGSAWAPGSDNTGSGGGGGGGGSSTGTLGVYNATGDAKVMIETDGTNASDVAKLVLQKGTAVANLSWNGTILEVDKSLNLSSTLSLGSTLTASSANSDVLLVGSGTDFQVKKTSVALSSLLTTSSSVTNVGTLSSLTVSGDATFDTNTLFVDSSANNVGIGTTTPDKYFYNSSATGGSFTSTDRILAIHGGTSGQNNGVARLVLACDANHTASIFAKHTGSGNTHMGFLTTDGTAAPVERMRIDEEGNVGIGTTSPTEKLEIGENSSTHDNTDKIICISQQQQYKYNFGITKWNKYSSGSGKYDLEIGYKHVDATNNQNYGHIILTPYRNVGIGTTSPGAKLVVAESTGFARLWVKSSTTGHAEIGTHNDGRMFIYNQKNSYMHFGTNGGEKMRIAADGKVGIGQTNPSYKLDVNGTGRFTGDLTVGGNITVNGTTTTVSTTNMVVEDSLIELNTGASSNANDCGIVIERGSTGDNAFMGWDESADKFLMGTTTATGASTGNLSVTTGTLVANLEGNVLTAAQTNITSVGTLSSLTVSGDVTFDTNTLKVDSSNNRVGIGTASPNYKLHVNAGTSGSNTVAFNGIGLVLAGSGGNNGSIGMLFNIREPDGTTSGSGAKAGIFGKDYAGTWNRSSLVFCTNNETNTNDTSISDAKMVIRETGKVGIGTTSPSHRFHIVGDGTAAATNLSTSVSNARLRFQNNSGSSLSKYQGITGSGASSKWYNQISNGAGNTLYDMLLNPFGGNVGIGGTSPGAKLEIRGTDDTGESYVEDILRLSGKYNYQNAKYGLSWYNEYNQFVMGAIRMQAGYNTNSPKMFFYNSKNQSTPTIKMTIDCDGNVGIGETSPSKPLHIKHSGGTAILIETTQGDVNTATNSIEWHDSAGQKAFVGDASGGNKTFHIWNNRGHVFVGGSSTTNVGIGNQTPSYKLDVSGDINFTGTLRKNGTEYGAGSSVFVTSGSDGVKYTSGNVGIGAAASANARLYLEDDSHEVLRIYKKGAESYGSETDGPSNSSHSNYQPKGTVISMSSVKDGTAQTNATFINMNAYNSSNGNSSVYLGNVAGNSNGAGNFVIGRRTGSTSFAESMRISKTGNVGIGTRDPGSKLEVVGSGTSEGLVTFSADSDVSMRLKCTHSTGKGEVYYEIIPGPASGGTNSWKLGTNDDEHLHFGWGALGSMNSNEKMTILNTGNVGIGTTSPGAPLEIHGGAGSGDEVLILSNSKDSSYTNIHALFIDGGAHYDVYNSSTIQTGKSTSNGENFHMNRYSDGDVCMCFGGGNVGIGDSTPSYKLDVAGDINLTGDISISGTDLGLNHLSDASVSGNEITLGISTTTAILPSPNGTVDLGSSSKKFDVLYASKLNNGVSFTLPTSDGSSGQFLKTDGSGTLSWGTASGGGGASALNDLSDVSTSGAQSNYALVYNGSSWAPAAQSGSGGSSVEYYSAHIQNISDINQYTGYTITSSTTYNSSFPAEYAFSRLGNKNEGQAIWISANSTYNSSGSYIGSVSTNSYNGEWIQINFGKKVKVHSYSITNQPHDSGTGNRSPGGYKLFGSNDGSSWTDVHTGSATSSDYSSNYTKTKDNTLSTPVTYQYFRLVINSTTGAVMTSIAYLGFYGTFEEPDLIRGAISTNVVHQRMTETATLTLPSNGKTEIEALRLTITPQSSFSKLEINYSIGIYEVNTYNFGFVVSRTVGGTETFFTPGGNDGVNDMTFGVPGYDTDYNSTPYSDSFSMIDEPNTTGVVVYKVYGKLAATSGSKTLHINRTVTDGTSEGFEDGISTSSVKEFSTFTHNIAEQKVQGRVLETIAGLCDGRTVSGSSGSYTLPNVTTFLESSSSSWQTLTGSEISYKPPPGTKQVIYTLSVKTGYASDSYIMQFAKFYIDGQEVTNNFVGAFGQPSQHYGGLYQFKYVVDIGTDDIANGRISSWDSLKTLKIEVRSYGTSYDVKYHWSSYKLGNYSTSSDQQLCRPTLEIQAIGEENLVYNLTNQYSITEGQVLETLAGVCDGRSVTVSSGTYTLPTVTTYYTVPTTSYGDFPGSVINYKPPPGTNQVIYKFKYHTGPIDTNYSMAMKFFIGGTEVTAAKSHTDIRISHDYTDDFYYIIEIGGTDDVANGKLASWDTLKEMKLQITVENNNFELNVNYNKYEYTGNSYGSAGYVRKPRLEIQAIGRGVIEGTIGNLYSSKVNMVNIKMEEQLGISITGGTKVEIEQFRMTIVPVHIDSKFEINYSIFNEFGTYNAGYVVSRTVNGTETLFTPGGNDGVNDMTFGVPYYESDYATTPNSTTFSMIDEPGTTDAIVYKLYGKTTALTRTLHINRTGTNGNVEGHEDGISFCSVKELPQQTTLHNPRYNSVIEQEGQVLETLTGICDGRSVSVSSGTYTLENVTAKQSIASTSYIKANGSALSYKPPPGTRQVIISYATAFISSSSGVKQPIVTAAAKIGSSRTTNHIQVFRSAGVAAYPDLYKDFTFVIDIGNVSTDDIANGKLASWDTHKDIEVSMKSYDTGQYSAVAHATMHDGSTWVEAGIFTPPRLTITAIGRKSDTTFLNSFFNERKGQVLETLAGVCDGRTIEVDSGTYTLTNVTTEYTPTAATWVLCTGSSIDYKPPPGAKQVTYCYTVATGRVDNKKLLTFRFKIDDAVVVKQIRNIGWSNSVYGNLYNLRFVIDIGTDDISNGRVISWDSLKNLKVEIYQYSTSYEQKLHYNQYYETSSDVSGYTFTRPSLEIQAIGDAAIQNATVVAGNSMIHFQGYSNSRKSFTLDTGTAKSNTFYDYSYHSGTGAYNMIQYKNIGGCMNNSTGEFTFPHTGLYSINMTAHMSDSDNNPRTYVYWQMNKTKGTYEGSAEPNVILCELPGFRERSTSSKILHFQAGESFIIHSGQSTQPEDIYLSITALQDQVPQAISARPGMTLETVAGVCDGRSITVSSGTYTLQNVTAEQIMSTTYTDITGSSISYKPPPGTRQVTYKFSCMMSQGGSNTHTIGHLKLFVDGTEITKFRTSPNGYYSIGRRNYFYVFEIGTTDSASEGKFSSWNTNKTIKLQFRNHDSGITHGVKFHRTKWWDGAASNQFSVPTLKVEAIGDGPGIVPSTGMNVVKVSTGTTASYTPPKSSPGVEIEHLRISIKPTATDSVISLQWDVFCDGYRNIGFRVTRNITGTDVLVYDDSKGVRGSFLAMVPFDETGTTSTQTSPQTAQISWHDEPNTTSEVTYKLWVGNSWNTNEGFFLNKSMHSTDSDGREYGVSSAIAIEYPKTARPLDTENALTIPPFVGATNKEKLYNQSGDLYFNGKQLSNEWYKNGGDLYRLGANVGIGKSNPAYKLDVTGDINFTGSIRQNGVGFQLGGLWSGASNVYRSSGMVGFGTSTFVDTTRNPNGIHIANNNGISFLANTGVTDSRNWRIRHDDLAAWGSLQISVSDTNSDVPDSSSNAVITMLKSGRVGIGTTTPSTALHVYTIDGSENTGSRYQINSSGGSSGSGGSGYLSLRVRGRSWFEDYTFHTSDSRIKKEIEDVPDNLALQQVRNIPCKYYKYVDTYEKGDSRTIGFIAQEVKSVLPMAVSIETGIIPSVYKVIQCEWTGSVMYSQELGTVSGVKYKFYVSNTNDDEVEKIVTGSSDNTFTFEQQWTNVFCYGREVDDFHTVDKNKLFALNFSATQELDRQQQADKAKIQTLETKVQTLETTLASQQTLIQSLMTRLEALENP